MQKNVVFYALCLLYVFSFASVVLEVTRFIYVSNNFTYHNNFFTPSVAQLGAIGLQLRLDLLETTLNGLCDFISQAILVRINIVSLVIHFKDLPLLDCMGKQYPCCGTSFNFSIHL